MSIRVGAVIAAGGSSSRMNGRDKLFVSLGGIPVIVRSCLAFEKNQYVSEIAVAARADCVERVQEELSAYGISKLVAVTAGGSTRQESVRNAVEKLSDCDYIAVHDGARPFVSQELINLCMETAVSFGAAVPALPVSETLKRAEKGIISATVDRRSLYRVQTPQVFPYNAYLSALRNCFSPADTDDSTLVERSGIPVHLCDGEANNIKITTKEDISRAESILRGSCRMRVGIGYDVHRLTKNRRLVLCGVDIPHEFGLSGHSDADVAAHAFIDALLGAAAMKDIGKLFPDTDAKYKDADSLGLLSEIVNMLSENGYTIGNMDITIIAQKPRLSPYIDEMRSNIAKACGCDLSAVSVKATTEEGLGFTGNEEGIAASAVCTLLVAGE